MDVPDEWPQLSSPDKTADQNLSGLSPEQTSSKRCLASLLSDQILKLCLAFFLNRADQKLV